MEGTGRFAPARRSQRFCKCAYPDPPEGTDVLAYTHREMVAGTRFSRVSMRSLLAFMIQRTSPVAGDKAKAKPGRQAPNRGLLDAAEHAILIEREKTSGGQYGVSGIVGDRVRA